MRPERIRQQGRALLSDLTSSRHPRGVRIPIGRSYARQLTDPVVYVFPGLGDHAVRGKQTGGDESSSLPHVTGRVAGHVLQFTAVVVAGGATNLGRSEIRTAQASRNH